MSWNDNLLSWANHTKSKSNNYFTIVTKDNYVINVFEEKRANSSSSVVRVQGASPDGIHFEFLENGNICQKRFGNRPSDLSNISAVFLGAGGSSYDQISSRICTPTVKK